MADIESEPAQHQHTPLETSDMCLDQVIASHAVIYGRSSLAPASTKSRASSIHPTLNEDAASDIVDNDPDGMDLAQISRSLKRSDELILAAEQPYCSHHQDEDAIDIVQDVSPQALQRRSRERITCCKFEAPYVEPFKEKPEYHLAELALFALMTTPSRRLTLNLIAKWICKRYSYYTDKMIAASSGDTRESWLHRLRDMLEQYDFPAEPIVTGNQVEFHLPRGREWVFLHRQRTRERRFEKFYDLPEEIRARIYYWALPLRSTNGWTVPADYIANRHRLQLQLTPPDVHLTTSIGGMWTIHSEQMRDLLSITRTCEQSRAEASQVFYNHTHFIFGEQTSKHLVDGCKTLLGFLKGLNARDPSIRSAVRHITLYYNPVLTRNPCQPAFALLAETRLRHLHIHINEGLLLNGDRRWKKDLSKAPGMAQLAQLRGLKTVTFSGMFMQLQKHLAHLTEPKEGDYDEEDVAQQSRLKQNVAHAAHVLRLLRDSSGISPAVGKKVTSRSDGLERAIDLLEDPDAAENRKYRPKRKQEAIKDVFLEDSDDDAAFKDKKRQKMQSPISRRRQAPSKRPSSLPISTPSKVSVTSNYGMFNVLGLQVQQAKPRRSHTGLTTYPSYTTNTNVGSSIHASQKRKAIDGQNTDSGRPRVSTGLYVAAPGPKKFER